ncbi:alpha/beta fold hydrolase [Micropruina sp.]|uniref:alpha/beta fold hydrolase n=1 Tax=Micropruina sp. TaxID=2737536 RepID=UPI0039E4D43E
MNTSHPSILFLSGAGLLAWIWDDVRDRLRDSYETQVAPRPVGGATGIRRYADAAIGSAPTERFAIVAHSAGGVVGAEVMRLAPGRVTGLLGVCAIVPRPGDSFLTAMPAPNRWILSTAMRLAGTRPPESAIRKGLAHGLDGRVTDRLIDDFTPESQSYYRERVGEYRTADVRGYVSTTEDREFPVALQRGFAANLGATWQRELPLGHLPMLENPEVLAETIAEFLDARPA